MVLKKYKEKFSNLSSYTTEQEKNALLVNLETPDIIKTCYTLGETPLNEVEALALIFKLREISVSDLIELTLTCGSCNYQYVRSVSIPDMFFQSDDLWDIDIGLFVDASELSDDNINSISIEEFDNLTTKIEENNKKIFNPEVEDCCEKCGYESVILVKPDSIISKFGIKNIYEQYVDISTFTNMTKSDTDGMYPFEREIFMGLIQQKEDEKGK